MKFEPYRYFRSFENFGILVSKFWKTSKVQSKSNTDLGMLFALCQEAQVLKLCSHLTGETFSHPHFSLLQERHSAILTFHFTRGTFSLPHFSFYIRDIQPSSLFTLQERIWRGVLAVLIYQLQERIWRSIQPSSFFSYKREFEGGCQLSILFSYNREFVEENQPFSVFSERITIP